MSVLSHALRRLQEDPTGDAARRRAPAGASFVSAPPTIGDRPDSAAPAWVGLTTQVVISPPSATQAAESSTVDNTASAPANTVKAAATDSLIPQANQADDETPNSSLDRFASQGEAVLACDLSSSHEQGRALAASLALEWRTRERDGAAIIVASSHVAAHDLSDRFIETNEAGLFARCLLLDDPATACRELLVLIDASSRRFARTVVLVDGHDTSLLELAAPRVDHVVLLATSHDTPEGQLLRAESRLRAAAPNARPRIVLAA